MIRDILDCIASSAVIPLLGAGMAEYHNFPKYAERFADIVSSYGRVTADVLGTADDGRLVVSFRIEREKKTVIQKCSVFSADKRSPGYSRGDRITLYFRDEGESADAIPENDNRYAHLYELHRKICIICFAAAAFSAAAAVIL